MNTIGRTTCAALAIAAAFATLTACSSETTQVKTGQSENLKVGSVDLSADCPANVVIQTDWNPQAEQGGLFNLLGDDATIDAGAKRVAGPMYHNGQWTGVNVEIRAGGPAIGNTSVPVQMYTDPDIMLGWVNADESIVNSAERPTTAVMATFEKAPWMVMWDPATYPSVKTIGDLGKTDAKVRYFEGTTFVDYLVGSGQLRPDQIDATYDGTPANFIAAGGKDAQQGFATVEPWVYENAVDNWKKPVNYQLVADTGYPIYAVSLSARTKDVTDKAACLRKLVPVIQQSTVDYFAGPAHANELLVDSVTQFNNGWIYPADEARNSTTQQRALGLVANGPGGTMGSFDASRVQHVIDLVTPIMARNGVTVAPNLAPATLATNQFLDPAIALK